MRRGRLIALAASGAILLALTALGLFFQSQDDPERFLAVALLQAAVYLVAIWLTWNDGSSRRLVMGIALIAALMRIPVLCAPPYLSTDVYRYVWDGRVIAAGIKPYRVRLSMYNGRPVYRLTRRSIVILSASGEGVSCSFSRRANTKRSTALRAHLAFATCGRAGRTGAS